MMTPSNFIVDVSESDFEYEVLSFSQNIPVVVEFWATWCQPCKLLGPMLERLTEEAGGVFRLARVDVDANPNLALRYGVRSVPTTKVISQGQVIAEFVGAQPENRVREFLSRLAPPSEASLAIEKAISLLDQHQWVEAEVILRGLLEQTPDQPVVLLGLTRSLLAQGNSGEAQHIMNTFPASRELAKVEQLRPLVTAMQKYEKDELPNETDLDAMYRNAIRLAIRGNHLAALDGLLDIMRQQKRYRNDRARQVILSILEIYNPEDELPKQYRKELASVLF